MARVTGHVYTEERKRGTVWYMSYRYPSGKQERKLIGDHWGKRSKPPEGFYREVDAKEVLDEKLADLRRGEIPDPGRSSGKTFGDAMAEFLRYCEVDKGCEESTMNGYRSVGKVLEKEFGADTPLSDLTEERFEEYRSAALDEERLSRRSVQKHLVQLNGVCKRAKRLKWVPSNEMEDVERVNLKPSNEFNVLTPSQVDLIAEKAREVEHSQDIDPEVFSAAITVAAYAGLRTGEARALRWRDPDFVNAMIHVRRNRPAGAAERPAAKGGKPRAVPMMDIAARALEALSRRDHATGTDDYVFCDRAGRQLDQDVLRDALYAAMTLAGIDRKAFPRAPGFTFHDLRHTFGTMAVQVPDWTLVDVQAYMGHADISTTMRYVHHVPKNAAAASFSEAVRRAKELDVTPAAMPVAA
jgi:integrase